MLVGSKLPSHRMRLAGANDGVFMLEALSAIHSASNGLPRNVNNLAAHCLMYAAGKGVRTIDADSVYQASQELL